MSFHVDRPDVHMSMADGSEAPQGSFENDPNMACLRSRSMRTETYTELHNNESIPYLVLAKTRLINGPPLGIWNSLVTACAEAHLGAQLACVFLANLATHAVATRVPDTKAPIGANLAELLITVATAVVHPALLAPTASGAYAGMVSAISVATVGNVAYGWLCFVAALHCFVWAGVVRFKLFAGFSGRLGTAAFMACTVTFLIAALAGVLPWSVFFDATHYGRLTGELYGVTAPSVLAGTMATVWTRHRSSNPLLVNPVAAGSIVGLALVLIVSVSSGGAYRYTNDMLGGILTGTFIGMASDEVVTSTGGWIVAAFIGGGMNMAFVGLFNGFGGKLGFEAFLSCLPVVVWRKVAARCSTRTGD